MLCLQGTLKRQRTIYAVILDEKWPKKPTNYHLLQKNNRLRPKYDHTMDNTSTGTSLLSKCSYPSLNQTKPRTHIWTRVLESTHQLVMLWWIKLINRQLFPVKWLIFDCWHDYPWKPIAMDTLLAQWKTSGSSGTTRKL